MTRDMADDRPVTTLGAQLRQVRRQWRRHALLEACGRVLFLAAIVLGLSAALARAASLSDAGALGLAAAAAAVILTGAGVFAWPLRRQPDDRQVARFVEERFPGMDDAVVTAVEVEEGAAAGDGFAPLVVAAAARRLADRDLTAAVDPRARRLAEWRAAGAVAASVLALVLAAPLLERALQVAYVRMYPSAVSVRVAPGDLRVATGTPVTIEARVSARGATLTRVAPAITVDAGNGPTTVPMTPEGDRFVFHLDRLERSFTYLVSAGPAVSGRYAVTALVPARVARIESSTITRRSRA